MATPKSSSASASNLKLSSTTLPNENASIFTALVHSVTSSPLNVFLTAICIGLVYLIYRSAQDKRETKSEPRKELKPLPKSDMTLEELRKYDGKSNEEGRILLAVNREIYDVTKGSRFYGPEGPYALLAGHDATRALALFAVDAVKDEWDDYTDLSVSQMATVTEWLEQFKEKYEYVGKLVRTEAEKSTPVEATDEEPDDTDATPPPGEEADTRRAM